MEKINITELLKDCLKGMKLYSPIFGDVYLDKIRPFLAVVVRTADKQEEEFLYDGRFGINGECMLFPSKENRDWTKFQRPFKDGDVITCTNSICSFVAIFKKIRTDISFYRYVTLTLDDEPQFNAKEGWADFRKPRLATEEEKQKLFQAIKDNGYKWNPETKTLKKLPKFKVGDRITDKDKFIYRITEITDKGYKLHDLKTTFITFEEADWYFVKVVDIFDINTLIPFESRVLVRSSYGDIWRPAIYGVIDSKKHYHYVVGGGYWTQCIPYEQNEHLLGTTNNCDEYYKTWE